LLDLQYCKPIIHSLDLVLQLCTNPSAEFGMAFLGHLSRVHALCNIHSIVELSYNVHVSSIAEIAKRIIIMKNGPLSDVG